MMNLAVEDQPQVSTRTHPPVVRGHHARGRIVVGIDGSEGSRDALRWAARQGTLTGASLDVVMTWEVPVLPYGVWTGYVLPTSVPWSTPLNRQWQQLPPADPSASGNSSVLYPELKNLLYPFEGLSLQEMVNRLLGSTS
jgi:nucleotide-binding universal stress UspA family protein